MKEEMIATIELTNYNKPIERPYVYETRKVEVEYNLDEYCDDYGYFQQVAEISSITYRGKRVDIIYPDFSNYHKLEDELIEDNNIVYDPSYDMRRLTL